MKATTATATATTRSSEPKPEQGPGGITRPGLPALER